MNEKTEKPQIMDKKKLGIIITCIFIGFPLIVLVWRWLYNKVYITGIAKNKKDDNGKTLLIKAVENNDINQTIKLIKKGVNIDLPDNYGRTALMYSFIKGNQKIINMLLAHGASINATDNNNESVLIWFLDSGQKEMVKLLIDMGANPNIGCKKDKTPLMLAAEKGYDDMIRLFLKKEIKLTETDSTGNTFLSYYQGDLKEIMNYNILIKIYATNYYPGKNKDLNQILRHFEEKKDYSTLKKFFLQTKKHDSDLRKKIVGFPYDANELIHDRDIIAVLQKDYVEFYSLSDKIELPNSFPVVFKDIITASFIARLLTDIEQGDMRNTYLNDFTKTLKKLGYEIDKNEIMCRACDGKGEHSNYESWNENDNYSYPCSCFDGKQVSLSVKSDGKVIVNYKSLDYN